jgi:protein TonB
MFKSGDGVSVVAAGDRGSPHAPLSLARGAPATEAYVVEDFTAASAFPIMELVYSFVRWDESLVYVDQALRIDGDLVKLDELRLSRFPRLATVNEGRGALHVRPGRDQGLATVSTVAPFVDEAAELRRAARAIVNLPPGEGVAASPDLLDPAGQPEAPTASEPAIPRIALPGPDPNRCMIASSDSANQAVRLAPGLFRQRPTGDVVTRYFPREAVEARLDGRAVLLCAIDPGGGLRCLVQSETPEGWGFGEAALRIGSHFRVAERLPDGRTTAGGALRLPIRFCLP